MGISTETLVCEDIRYIVPINRVGGWGVGGQAKQAIG